MERKARKPAQHWTPSNCTSRGVFLLWNTGNFRGRGWRSISGDSQKELTSENGVLHLLEYALLGAGGNVKLLTCGCRSDINPKCSWCMCGKAGRPVVCTRLLQVQAEVHRTGGQCQRCCHKWWKIRRRPIYICGRKIFSMWGVSERGEDDASTTSDLGDYYIEDLENDVT